MDAEILTDAFMLYNSDWKKNHLKNIILKILDKLNNLTSDYCTINETNYRIIKLYHFVAEYLNMVFIVLKI